MHKRDIFRRIEVAADTVEEPMVPIKDAFASLAKICIKIENICFSRFCYLIVKGRDNKKIFIADKSKGQENSFIIKISKVGKTICHFSLFQFLLSHSFSGQCSSWTFQSRVMSTASTLKCLINVNSIQNESCHSHVKLSN